MVEAARNHPFSRPNPYRSTGQKPCHSRDGKEIIPASPLGTAGNLCYSMGKAVVFVKKLLKQGLAVVAAIVICLVVLFAVPIILVSIPGFLWIHWTDKDIKDTKSEIFSCVLEYKTPPILESDCNAVAFYYDTNSFLDYGFDQGYYFSVDDTYWLVDANDYSETADCVKELTKTDAKRYRKGFRTEDRYYTEKICNNWYYFQCPIDD